MHWTFFLINQKFKLPLNTTKNHQDSGDCIQKAVRPDGHWFVLICKQWCKAQLAANAPMNTIFHYRGVGTSWGDWKVATAVAKEGSQHTDPEQCKLQDEILGYLVTGALILPALSCKTTCRARGDTFLCTISNACFNFENICLFQGFKACYNKVKNITIFLMAKK